VCCCFWLIRVETDFALIVRVPMDDPCMYAYIVACCSPLLPEQIR
jgi:hypothetical protein